MFKLGFIKREGEPGNEGNAGATNEGNAGAVADLVNTRPEHCPEKFWDSEAKSIRNDDVLKSYNELSTKFGSFTGAPDEYKYAVSDDLKAKGVELDLENPMITTFSEMAKSSGMNQEMANKMINMYLEGEHAKGIVNTEGEEQRRVDEMKLLGSDGERRVSNLSAWAKANMTPEEAKGLEDATTTAAGVMAIEALIAKSRNTSILDGGNSTESVDTAELQKLQFEKDEFGNRRMATDPEFRKMVQDKFARAYPGEHRVQVG